MLLRAHADNSPLAFVTLDQDLVIRDWSKGAERMFGRNAADLLGQPAARTGWLSPEGAATLSACTFARCSSWWPGRRLRTRVRGVCCCTGVGQPRCRSSISATPRSGTK